MLPPKLGSHAFFKIRNPIRNPELELDPNPRSGAPKNRIFEKLTRSGYLGQILAGKFKMEFLPTLRLTKAFPHLGPDPRSHNLVAIQLLIKDTTGNAYVSLTVSRNSILNFPAKI